MSHQCAILAGGLATRLRPKTLHMPKSMIPHGGRPFLEHQLELLKRGGITRALLCIGYLGHQIKDHFGTAWNGVEIEYSFEGNELLGTGGALRKAADKLDDSFLVLYGDSYLMIDYEDIYARFTRVAEPALLTVYRNTDDHYPNNVLFEDGTIKLYDKGHPATEMKHIDLGLSVLEREVIEGIPESELFDLADLYRTLSLEGQLAGVEVTQRFYEAGSPHGVEEFEGFLNDKGN